MTEEEAVELKREWATSTPASESHELLPTDPRAELFVLLLREARRQVAEGSAYTVCPALMWAAVSEIAQAYRKPLCKPPLYTGAELAAHALIDWIAAAIGENRSVAHWLMQNGIPVDELTQEARRAYRLRWIDHMIAYFEKKENGDGIEA